MSEPNFGTTAYTVRRGATRHTVQAAYRGALIALRHRLEVLSLDLPRFRRTLDR